MKPLKKTRFWSLALGVLTAFVIVFSQVFYVANTEQFTQDHSDTEQQSPESEEKGQVTLSTYSLPSSSTSLVLNHDFSFIQEILFYAQKPEGTPTIIQRSVGKLFKALFQFIISPNAP